jgi:general secretion pathway protein D
MLNLLTIPLARPRRALRGVVALVCALGLTASAAAQATGPVQVRLEARIIEWQTSDALSFDFAVRYTRVPGSDSSLQAADLTLPGSPPLQSAARLFIDEVNVGQSGSLDGVIETLQSVGDVRILSQPSIVLTSRQTPLDQLNTPAPPPNYDAKLSNNQRIPYETVRNAGYTLASVTEYRDSGVTLDVSVLNVTDGLVILDMRTEVSDLVDTVNVGVNGAGEPMAVPVLDSRMVRNRLIVPDRTPFIAGLLKTVREDNGRQGIPWLSELPLLRWIFASNQDTDTNTELVFLVKAEIVTPYRPVVLEGGQ